MMPNRRSFLIGAAALIAMPAVVRAESLMKLHIPAKPKLIIAVDVADPLREQTVGVLMQDGQIIGHYTFALNPITNRKDVRWFVNDPHGERVPGGIAGAAFKEREWSKDRIVMLPMEPIA